MDFSHFNQPIGKGILPIGLMHLRSKPRPKDKSVMGLGRTPTPIGWLRMLGSC
jgi:hypothetical protein